MLKEIKMRRKVVKWLLVITWMVIIFIFSNQNGDQSGHNNKFVIEALKNIGINLDTILGSIDNYLIRKLGHMTEYFILFHLLYNALCDKYNFWKASLASIAVVFIYACSDEFHQRFIPGRGPSFKDVMIDTGGGSLALIGRIIVTHKKRSDKEKKHLTKE
jgi:VanZ family protein